MNNKHKSFPLKLGLIGGGISSTIGETHFIASQLDKRFEVVTGSFSKNFKININTAKKWGLNKDQIYKNWQTLVKKENTNVDAFVVLLPTPDHYSILKEKNCSYAFTSAPGIANLDKDHFKLPRKDTNDFPQ